MKIQDVKYPAWWWCPMMPSFW